MKDLEEEEEEEEETDSEEDNLTFDGCAFKAILNGSQQADFPYQRGPEPSLRSHQLKKKATRELAAGAEGSKKIYEFFKAPGGSDSSLSARETTPISQDSDLPAEQLLRREREKAIKAMEQTLCREKRHALNGQTLARRRAVLSLKIQQSKQQGEARESMAQIFARCFERGVYFARKVISWGKECVQNRTIPEGRRGCFVGAGGWFNDEGAQNAVRKWLQEHAKSPEAITAYALAKVVGNYLDYKRAAAKILMFGPGGNRVRARTGSIGWAWYTKGIYVQYRNNTFLSRTRPIKNTSYKKKQKKYILPANKA